MSLLNTLSENVKAPEGFEGCVYYVRCRTPYYQASFRHSGDTCWTNTYDIIHVHHTKEEITERAEAHIVRALKIRGFIT